MISTSDWDIDRSRLVYGLNRSDLHFLDIDNNGDLMLRLNGHTISFREIIKSVRHRNSSRTAYTSSFTLRIPQLIGLQIDRLQTAFRDAMNRRDYTERLTCIYPVKVNQRADCVFPILRHDRNYGLEVGTKSELFLAEYVTSKERDRLIICNGAKDHEYIDEIRRAVERGHNVAVSVESLHEARMLTRTLPPEQANIVLRLKPYVTVQGHWSKSAGRHSKFGLSIQDLFDVCDFLKDTGHQDCVKAILGHVGSQITSMEDIRQFAHFMTNAYLDLRQLGLRALRAIDFGGGLPIDYMSSYSKDMTRLYAGSILDGILERMRLDKTGSPRPAIVIESGRVITALYAAIVVKALEVRSIFPQHGELSAENKRWLNDWTARLHAATSIDELIEIWREVHEMYNTPAGPLTTLRENEQVLGILGAEARRQIARLLDTSPLHADLHVIDSLWYPEHIVIGNFSIFNSILDHVLVNQYFPVIPISDLHIRPQTTVRLVDITCDSDGEISTFHLKDTDKIWFTRDFRPLTMPNATIRPGIPVGSLKSVPGSYFVIPLVGAYQDVLEANHNLLGDLPDVELTVSDDGTWNIAWRSNAQQMKDLITEQGYFGVSVEEDPYMAEDQDSS